MNNKVHRLDDDTINQIAAGEIVENPSSVVKVELIADGKAYRQFLNPGAAPEAFFSIVAQTVTAREYCNLHGLWKNES